MTKDLINAKENNGVVYPLSAGCSVNCADTFQHLITQKRHRVATVEKSKTGEAVFRDILLI